MSKISKIEISKFWGNKDISLSLHPDVNFLIGRNGSGKTTIINIITAAIRVDISSLLVLPFSSVIISFDDSSCISVRKKLKTFTEGLEYSVRFRNNRQKVFNISSIEPFRFLLKDTLGSSSSHFEYKSDRDNCLEEINRLIQLSWVSVNRTSLLEGYSEQDQERDKTTTDVVLNKLSIDLSSFFSRLQTCYNNEMKKFQKYVFESFVEETGNVYEDKYISSDENRLLDIYKRFDIQDADNKVSSFYKKFRACLEKSRNHEPLDITDLSLCFEAFRIHSLVNKWMEIDKAQTKIFERREVFFNIMNDLLSHKEIIINSSNEIRIKNLIDGSLFDVSKLSSGEKQLLIILGRALLQEDEGSYCYITDEPELSLHVEWQEKLASSIIRISPHSQVIFATHSPDIVGPYQDRIINVESIIYGK